MEKFEVKLNKNSWLKFFIDEKAYTTIIFIETHNAKSDIYANPVNEIATFILSYNADGTILIRNIVNDVNDYLGEEDISIIDCREKRLRINFMKDVIEDYLKEFVKPSKIKEVLKRLEKAMEK